MPDAIHYCDVCGRLVRPSEIDEGKAVVRGTQTFCGECIAKLPPEKQRELRGGRATPAPVRRVTPRPGRRSPVPHTPSGRHGHSGRHGATEGRGASRVLLASGGVGLALGLVVVLVIIGGGEPAAQQQVPPREAVAMPVAPPAFAPAVAPSPAEPPPVAATPAADAVDDEYLQMLRAQSEARRERATSTASVPGGRLQEVVKKWDPVWKLVRTRDDQGLTGQSPLSHLGREKVLVTHPLPGGEPAALSREVSIPAGSTATLTITATTGGRDQDEDWVLAVIVDDVSLGERVVGRINGSPQWQTFRYDLSRFAGRAVSVRLENRAGGNVPWAWEHAFWAEARIDIQ